MKEIPYIRANLDLDELEADQRKRVAAILVGDISLQELIRRYDASVKNGKIVNDDYWDIPIVLRDKFGVVRIEDVNKAIEEICTKIGELEAKFRNHRHETGKTYSAKPEY